MYVNTASNISPTPFNAKSQSPVNTPTNTSTIPSITSNIALNAAANTSNAPINTGPNNSQRPNQIILIKSTIFDIASFTPSILDINSSINVINVCFTCSHIAITLFLNSSFVVHNVINAPTNIAIAAINKFAGVNTAVIADCNDVIKLVAKLLIKANGDENDVNVVINPLTSDEIQVKGLNADTILPIAEIIAGKFNAPTAVVTRPTPDANIDIKPINFPTINITGPIAAAIPNSLTMFSCCAGAILLNVTNMFFIDCTKPRNTPFTISDKITFVVPNADVNNVQSPCRLSIIIPACPADAPNISKLESLYTASPNVFNAS